MDCDMKEVKFSKYCPLCKHETLEEGMSPCNECLENGANLHSEKPLYFEEKT